MASRQLVERKKNLKSRRIAQCSGGVKSKRVCAAIRTPPIIYNSENCTTNTQYCPSQKRARWWFPCCAVGSFINCVTPCMIMITANLFQKAIKYQFATSISNKERKYHQRTNNSRKQLCICHRILRICRATSNIIKVGSERRTLDFKPFNQSATF